MIFQCAQYHKSFLPVQIIVPKRKKKKQMLDGDSMKQAKLTHVNLVPFLHCLDRGWFHHHHEALLYALAMSGKKKGQTGGYYY